MPTALNSKFLPKAGWITIAMLVTLHLALIAGTQSIWSRPLLLAHLGLFLLWQPLWRGESTLSTANTLLIGLASMAALLWLNWWTLTFWLSGLFSLMGSRVLAFPSRLQRWRYLLAMVYLLSALLLWVIPRLLGLPIVADTSSSLMYFALPILIALMVLLPSEDEQAISSQFVDFIYSLLLFLLLTLLVLGSVVFMHLAEIEYFDALLRSLFIIAIALLSLSWLWNPRLGFSGLQPVFSRYLMNIGSPFEVWLKHLTITSQHELTPLLFLMRAIDHFFELPWVSGFAWSADVGHGNAGVSSPHRIEVDDHDLHITFFSRQPISPSTAMHIHLLVQLLGHFYQSKKREQRLREFARLQAIYETGSRLTHDLKNMLQSLLSLTSVAQHQGEKAQPVLQRQLPVLTQRIELILSKLKAPELENDAAVLPLAMWWDSLKQRHRHAHLIWQEDPLNTDVDIPAALFDCVADNLIDNAYNKRLREPELQVSIKLCAMPLSLSISDTGSAIPAGVAAQLLDTIVPSEDGLGVGLFQAARWAKQMGYRLTLTHNKAGDVRFELKRH
ncbi:MAG: sensor histidine kinase [Gallionellaceae bacterium]|nr:sensor histidine kinase [Gallionellaceae bacterium]